jgi:hypothetical protein
MTVPVFKKANHEDFNKQKKRLIDYLNHTTTLGVAAFEGKENVSFGRLTSVEWSNMFYKHLNHHLEQFAV